MPYAQPSREPMSRCGERVIDSMPAATTTVASPTAIMRAPSMMAVSPDRHTLLTEEECTSHGMPAPTAAWRAGFWPEPAGST